MSTIHVIRHDESTGPFSEEEIQEQLARGELTPADYAWREGMADWQPLAEVVALPTSPPPPPGPEPAPPPAADPTSAPPSRKKRRVPPAFTMTGLTEFLEVFPDRLTITPKGTQVLQTQGTQGIREISVRLLLDIGYKLPGFTSGYLQFAEAGGAGGGSKSPTDANTFRFAKSSENIDVAGRITAYVQERIQEQRAVPRTMAPASLSEELGRLAVLREQGALTDEEFQAAKQRLLA